MPLSPGQLVGYDDARRVFMFTMLNRNEIVQCEISASAMDDLAGDVSGGPAGREAQFLTVRREIERVASAVFDDGPSDNQGGIVRIFAKHLERQRKPRDAGPIARGRLKSKRLIAYFGVIAWPTRGMIRGRCRLTWGTRISSTRFATPSCHLIDSRTFGGKP